MPRRPMSPVGTQVGPSGESDRAAPSPPPPNPQKIKRKEGPMRNLSRTRPSRQCRPAVEPLGHRIAPSDLPAPIALPPVPEPTPGVQYSFELAANASLSLVFAPSGSIAGFFYLRAHQ